MAHSSLSSSGIPSGAAASGPGEAPFREEFQEFLASLPAGQKCPEKLDTLLHLAAGRPGGLTAARIHAIHEATGASLSRIQEAASFCDRAPAGPAGEDPSRPHLGICGDLVCTMTGGPDMAGHAAGVWPRARVSRVNCPGICHAGPAALLNGRPLSGILPLPGVRLADTTPWLPPRSETRDVYLRRGGYDNFRKLVDGSLRGEQVISELRASGLTGCGGEGRPVAGKWLRFLDSPGPRRLVVNIHESGPGAIRDRLLCHRSPHQILEGIAITAQVTGVSDVIIALRGDYAELVQTFSAARSNMAALGVILPVPEFRIGGNAIILGEETALVSMLKGQRPAPDGKFPGSGDGFPENDGFLVHNVETLYWIPRILLEGGAAFSGYGRNGATGLRVYGVSGRVGSPGLKIAPAGLTLRELVDGHAGGMASGRELHAFMPGGIRGGLLPSRLAAVPLHGEALAPHGAMAGGNVILLSEQEDLRAVVLDIIRLLGDQSCGKCLPCRAGCMAAATLLAQEQVPPALLRDLGQTMERASLCGLGREAPRAFMTLMRYFPEMLT